MYIYQNSQKYNQQDLCRLSLLFFFAEIRCCLFGAPCSRRIGSFVLYHRNPYTPAEKTGFGKPKILLTVFQMLKYERTGNLYKHAQSLLELCRTCAESKKREVHTSLSQFQEISFIDTLGLADNKSCTTDASMTTCNSTARS